ncbi:MAG TPA: hypothetical protein VGQ00_03495 [Candidatus Norongarragalinales archaeon]|jgi:hypothetical protein|nr:hypothetical protein [Candidatus Norongarragalinales archaeon]
MKRRGVFFTLAALLLFSILLSWWAVAASSMSREDALERLATGRKLNYAWWDVAEDVQRFANVTLLQYNNTLEIQDHLPAVIDVQDFLKAYSRFVGNRTARELNVSWLDAADRPINLEDVISKILIQSVGFNYTWTDWGKRSLIISCPAANCTALTQLDLSYNLTNFTFDYPPDLAHQNDYDWSPDAMKNQCPGSTCINFTLYVRDGNNSVYSCPGPICSYTQFPYDKKSKIEIKGSPCWIKIILGDNTGQARDIVTIRQKQPGGGGDDDEESDCTADMDAGTKMTFNQSVTTNFLMKLDMLDLFQNASRRDFVPPS